MNIIHQLMIVVIWIIEVYFFINGVSEKISATCIDMSGMCYCSVMQCSVKTGTVGKVIFGKGTMLNIEASKYRQSF